MGTATRTICVSLAISLAAPLAIDSMPAKVLDRIDSSMVPVEGGAFVMGCTPGQDMCEPEKHPAHQLDVARCEIARH